MTSVIDRPANQAREFSTSDAAGGASNVSRGSGNVIPLGRVLQWFVAMLLLGAAAIHFAVMGEHAGISWSHGLFFAAVAWAQVALAAAIVLRPSRMVALGVIVINAAVIAVWIVSRTAGIALGGDGTPEAWGWVDGLSVAFEGAAILGCIALLARGIARRPVSRSVGIGTTAAIGAVVIALTAWFFTPAFAGASDGGSAHAHGSGDAHAAGGHGQGAAPVDDKGLSALSNGHHDAFGPEQPLDAATRAELARQISITQEVAAKLPTVAAATAAGYKRAGPFTPGLGAHYTRVTGPGLNADGVVDDADLRNPLAIIYDGTNPESRVAGFMYYSMSSAQPSGFAGPNDLWHFHKSLCLKNGPDGVDSPFGADAQATKAQCDQVGGYIMKQTQFMLHVWSVPGWESQQGLFGEVNPALSCSDGTYHQRAPKDWIKNLRDTCLSAPV